MSTVGPRVRSFFPAVVLLIGLAACQKQESSGPSGGLPKTATPKLPEPKSFYVRDDNKDNVIVFVNGVFGDARSTWTNSATSAYWPELVAQDPEFSNADIYVHSFESPPLARAQEILELAGSLKNYLDAKGVIADHKKVVFVCHSMGGLVTRAYLLAARVPPEKIAFLFFLATPTAGANVASFAAALSPNPQLLNMRPLGPDTYVKDLREQWLRASDDPTLDYPRKVSSYCGYEIEKTWGIQVVEEVSATYLCNRGTTAINADHLSIVKPASKDAEAYVAFLAAYKNQLGPAAVEIRTALATVSPQPFVMRRTFRIADLPAAKIALRQAAASGQPVTAACGATSEGEVSVAAELAAGETVAEVHPEIVNARDVTSSSAVVERFDGKTAVVRYRIVGGCPAGGSAQVAVNFVTSHPRAFAPGIDRFVRPTVGGAIGTVDHVPAAVAAGAVLLPSPTPKISRGRVRGGAAILVTTPAH